MTDRAHTDNPFWGHFRVAEEAVEKHESSDLEHRELALEAIASLLKDIVLPWADKKTDSEILENGPSPHEIAGLDRWGPRQDAFFNKAFPKFEYGSLDQLREVMDEAEIEDQSQPTKLFEAWSVSRASLSINTSARFLAEGRDDVSEERRQQEANQLLELLKQYPVPEFIGWQLASKVHDLDPDLAEERADEFDGKVREWLEGVVQE